MTFTEAKIRRLESRQRKTLLWLSDLRTTPEERVELSRLYQKTEKEIDEMKGQK